MSTPTNTPKPASPLRGLAVGVILLLILFPAARTVFTATAGVIIGVIVGTLIAAFVFFRATARR